MPARPAALLAKGSGTLVAWPARPAALVAKGSPEVSALDFMLCRI
jgi:hypothetical protein